MYLGHFATPVMHGDEDLQAERTIRMVELAHLLADILFEQGKMGSTPLACVNIKPLLPEDPDVGYTLELAQYASLLELVNRCNEFLETCQNNLDAREKAGNLLEFVSRSLSNIATRSFYWHELPQMIKETEQCWQHLQLVNEKTRTNDHRTGSITTHSMFPNQPEDAVKQNQLVPNPNQK